MKTPVALIIFNRPDTTERVFAGIAQARPPKLLVVADGPRADHPGEDERCAAARAIVERVDWDCEVLTSYSDVNLGCRRRVSSGLNWVFSLVDEAIILEDDCLPHPTFFRFCEELLERYRDDERIMHISGNNFQLGHKHTHYSYYFSRYNHIWGWSSWRRAWRFYDVEMKLWPEFRDGRWLQDILDDSGAAAYWARCFQAAYEDKVNSWDYQWTFACWTQGGLSVLPNVNLISNIGSGADSTHTADGSWFTGLPVEAMRFPLQHPPFVVRDVQADAFTQQSMFISTLPERIKGKLKRTLRSYRLHGEGG